MPIRLATPDCPRGIILRAVPLAEQNDVFDVFRPAALITLTDLDQPCRVLRQELVALFGLTEREADVTALVCEGVTTEKAAHQLAISEYTVRQHLKAVFGKIGVSRQAELVAIVSRLS
jgi:DNA-binding CsgD family transcriptional regulator